MRRYEEMIEDDVSSYAEGIVQTAAAIFETMMGLEIRSADWPWSPETSRVAATVHFTGTFDGVLTLHVSPEQACFLAGRFLSMDTPDALDNDVRDVLGELANMIGGNLKSAIAPAATLSIPEVVDGTDFSLRICGVSLAERIAFESEAGVFWVSLVHSGHREASA